MKAVKIYLLPTYDNFGSKYCFNNPQKGPHRDFYDPALLDILIMMFGCLNLYDNDCDDCYVI